MNAADVSVFARFAERTRKALAGGNRVIAVRKLDGMRHLILVGPGNGSADGDHQLLGNEGVIRNRDGIAGGGDDGA